MGGDELIEAMTRFAAAHNPCQPADTIYILTTKYLTN
jgi:hypothetical protein